MKGFAKSLKLKTDWFNNTVRQIVIRTKYFRLLILIGFILIVCFMGQVNAQNGIVPVLSSDIQTSPIGDGWYQSDAAFNGNNYIVVWQRYGGGIRGQLVSTGGSLIGAGFDIAPSRSGTNPAIAFNGVSYLVVSDVPPIKM